MKLHSVLCQCLIDGTSSNEKGKSVRIQQKDDETILLLRTDTESARQFLGIKKASDLLFLYMKDKQAPKLVFVELKGSDISKAAEQLIVTIKAVRSAMTRRVGPTANALATEAVVVFSGSTPQSLAQIQKTFRAAVGVSLRTQRETLDIRGYL